MLEEEHKYKVAGEDPTNHDTGTDCMEDILFPDEACYKAS
jgi:hypothetical protein